MKKIQGKYAVIPSDEMIELLNDTIDKIENLKRARHINMYKHNQCF